MRTNPNPAQVAELLKRGVVAAKAGRMEEARQVLLRVIEMDARNEQAWLWLSGVIESYQDRRVCLENVLAINPNNGHARSGLHWLDQQAPLSLTTEERCPRCQALAPPSGTTCRDCGQILIVACPACGQYTDVPNTSCPDCGQSLGNFADGPNYHLALAQAYLEKHRGEMAQEAIARAAAEASGDPQVLEGVAALYEKMGHTDKAIATYEQAIERDPKNATFYARLGAIYRRRAMLAEARAMYEQATEIAGDDPLVLFELAQLQVEQGAAREALKLLRQVVRLDPQHAEAHLLLGDVLFDQKQGPQALDHYEQAGALAAPDSLVGQEARRKLAKWRSPLPDHQIQGWGETLRRMCGLMLTPALAALVNAGMIPWKINPIAWSALVVAGAGAYLWVCATDVPRNPVMRDIFGQDGVKGVTRQTLVGIPGVLLWTTAFGVILMKL
jgi:tetratricopeptide (TPR) repeat protein